MCYSGCCGGLFSDIIIIFLGRGRIVLMLCVWLSLYLSGFIAFVLFLFCSSTFHYSDLQIMAMLSFQWSDFKIFIFVMFVGFMF